jgi:hypothetical protein
MSRKTYTATLPNGESVKRTTDSRTYTHAIAVGITWGRKAEQARDSLAMVERWQADESVTTDYSRNIAACRARLTEAEAHDPEGIDWGVSGWAGRPDLADKAARQARKVWSHVAIIPATEVTR